MAKKPITDLVAINRVAKTLEGLTNDERRRVLQYVVEKYINEPARTGNLSGAGAPTPIKQQANAN